MKQASIIIILIALLQLAAQCQVQPTDLSAETLEETGSNEAFDQEIELSAINLKAGKKLKVVVTTNIIGDLVTNVGGDLIDLTVLMPLGADVHTFTPTPGDAASIADAHVVFINGLKLEEFLEELIENAGGEAIIVAVSTGVETQAWDEVENHTNSHDEEGDLTDPHIWMTPVNAIIMVRNIKETLSKLDPANADTYQSNSRAYEAQLVELDEWVKTEIERIPAAHRQLVTDHDALGYYANRYGLEIVGTVIPAYSTNAAPSAQELAALQDAIAEHHARAIFVDVSANLVLADRVSDDTGIRLVPLYTSSLGKPGSGVETYIDFIRYDTTAIVDALK